MKNRILYLIASLLIMMHASAQLPAAPTTENTQKWYKFKNYLSAGRFITDSMNRMPLDTFSNAETGSLAYKDNKLFLKRTTGWAEIGGGAGGTQMQADYSETNTASVSYIKNKPKTYTEEFFGTSNTITLSRIPIQESIVVYINGVKVRQPVYTVVGSNQIQINNVVLTWTLAAADKIEVTYQSIFQ